MSCARESPVQGKPFAGARILENDWSAKPICAEQPPRARAGNSAKGKWKAKSHGVARPRLLKEPLAQTQGRALSREDSRRKHACQSRRAQQQAMPAQLCNEGRDAKPRDEARGVPMADKPLRTHPQTHTRAHTDTHLGE
jgi:hypothetical protein